MVDSIHKIAIIGSGNVANALAVWLHQSGENVCQVYSRNIASAKLLAAEANASAIADLSLLKDDLDLIIIAVKDDVVHAVSNSIEVKNAIVVHTSGTVPISALSKHKNSGVFYPLQTFKKGAVEDFKNIPICLEASNELAYNALESFCKRLAVPHYPINSVQRGTIHVAAVFANNFTNHLWGISKEILESHNIDAAILNPLMKETLQKAMTNNPYLIQTGPAIRKDELTLRKHQELLGVGIKSEIYRLLSTSIQTQKKNEE
jgi:predicted short-subunit dehydrogenase-like oxidoreductase (DUF2520 family)